MGKSTLDTRIERLRENLCCLKTKLAVCHNENDWRLIYGLLFYLNNPKAEDAWFWKSVAESAEDPAKVSFAYRPEDVQDDKRRRFCSMAKFLKGRARQHGATFTDEEADRIAFLVGTHFPRGDAWEFKECKGEELSDGYAESPNWGSCMSGNRYFDMLATNPEKVSLVKIHRAGEWVGRALLWTADQGTRVLDRVYPSDEGAHVDAAWEWARAQGYDYRTTQCCGDAEMNSGNDDYRVTLHVGSADEFPYLDTFKYTDGNPREDSHIVLKMTPSEYSFTETDGSFDGDCLSITCNSCGDRVSDEDSYSNEDGGTYCSRCYSERYVNLEYRHNGRLIEGEYRRDNCSKCPECNSTRYDDHMVDVEGTFYCHDCVPDVASYCEECNEQFLHENLTECDDKNYCSNCLSEVSAKCQECGSRHLLEDMKKVDSLGPHASKSNQEKYVCTECVGICRECGQEKPLSSECRSCASRTQLALMAV